MRMRGEGECFHQLQQVFRQDGYFQEERLSQFQLFYGLDRQLSQFSHTKRD